MIYSKKFAQKTDYDSYKESEGYIAPNVSYCEDTEEVYYNQYVPPPHDYSKDYLTFKALESGTFKLSGNSVDYSLDNGETWTALASNTNSPTVNSGDTILWKATLTPSSSYGIGTFSSTANFTVEGNPMSLLYGDDFKDKTDLTGKDYAFYYLFSGCTRLTSAENLSLPATTLSTSGYSNMFYNCTSLTTAPELPATTLATSCYRSMFYGCTSLTEAPSILPATTLANSCYNGMFASCSGLTTAPELPATTLADYCYYQMFNGCTSLTTAPELPVTTLATSCYGGMFYGCTSLTTAPSLLATTLANGCYEGMFQNCSSLTTAPELQATTLADNCYNSMFYNCSGLTTAPSLPATTLANSCYNYMFYKCTSLTTAPELPATTLTNYCYCGMFQGCSGLNSIKCLATNISASNCTYNWVNKVSSSGTFTKAASMTSWTTGNNGIPSGWTVQDAT